MIRFRLPKQIVAELDATGLPWRLETGRPGHGKVFLGGRLVLAMCSLKDIPNRRMFLNVRATIRRTARELKAK